MFYDILLAAALLALAYIVWDWFNTTPMNTMYNEDAYKPPTPPQESCCCTEQDEEDLAKLASDDVFIDGEVKGGSKS